jgi:hypothetical protein
MASSETDVDCVMLRYATDRVAVGVRDWEELCDPEVLRVQLCENVSVGDVDCVKDGKEVKLEEKWRQ